MKYIIHLFLLIFITFCFSCKSSEEILQKEKSESPLDDLPKNIRQLTTFGQRADWSHDGEKILFIEKTFGDVYEVEVETGKLQPATHHYYHEGYVRALYLSNGDILLAGDPNFNAKDPIPSRKKRAEFWVLKKDLKSPPYPLGELCYEGPAVSRKNMHIAWTIAGGQPEGSFYSGDIIYENDTPKLVNKKKILDKTNLGQFADIETQNFRPPNEEELIFSGYGPDYTITEVLGLNLLTGEIINYSKRPEEFNEPEGIYPDGKYTTVETIRPSPYGLTVDMYRLALDGSGEMKRLTFFGDYKGGKASNAVISDDGNYMAFQAAKTTEMAGVGHGILILDLNKNY